MLMAPVSTTSLTAFPQALAAWGAAEIPNGSSKQVSTTKRTNEVPFMHSSLSPSTGRVARSLHSERLRHWVATSVPGDAAVQSERTNPPEAPGGGGAGFRRALLRS